jgi:hypothetical protein
LDLKSELHGSLAQILIFCPELFEKRCRVVGVRSRSPWRARACDFGFWRLLPKRLTTERWPKTNAGAILSTHSQRTHVPAPHKASAVPFTLYHRITVQIQPAQKRIIDDKNIAGYISNRDEL